MAQTSKANPSHPSTPTRPVRRRAIGKTSDAQKISRRFAVEAARLLQELHCENTLVLDVRGRNQVTDYLIIATGTSDRQILSVGTDVAELAKTHGLKTYGRDADQRTSWLVLDFVTVMVHLFEAATRAHYDLEMMWGDVPRIRWRRTVRPFRSGAKREGL